MMAILNACRPVSRESYIRARQNPSNHWQVCTSVSRHITLRSRRVRWLVSCCSEPSLPQRITSGLNTEFTLSPSYSFHKSSYYKSWVFVLFFSLYIFRRHSTREAASSRVTYFILQADTGTSVSHSQHRKKLGEILDLMQVNWPEG